MIKKFTYLFFTAVLLTVFLSCSNKQKSPAQDPKLMATDIQVIQLDISNGVLKNLYNPEPFEQLKQRVLNNEVKQEDCVLELRKIISSYNVAHLNIHQNHENGFVPEYSDTAFLNFDDGVRVYYTSLKNRKYIGWKVLEAGNLPVQDFLKTYNSYFSFETETGRKYSIHAMPLDWKVLRHAGLLKNKGTLLVKIESDEGQIKTIKCHSNKGITSPLKMFLKPEKYTSLSINAKSDKTVVLDRIPETGIYSFQLISFDDYKKNNYKECLDTMMEELSSGNYHTVVFDLRANGGGSIMNLITYESQLYAYKEELSKYNLAIAVSGRTYSAACRYIDYCVSIFPDIKIFGEESGQAIFNYTSVIPENLRHLNSIIIFPFELDSMPALEKRCSDVTRGIIPDVEVLNTFQDFMKGHDAVYAAIYEYYK